MNKNLVLTPECSLNWLFDTDFIFNMWENNYFLIMDSNDFYKHRRVASTSELSLIKYFILSILYFVGRLKLIDYKKVYTNNIIKKNMLFLEATKKMDFNKYETDISQAYTIYIGYVKKKENVIKEIQSLNDKRIMKKEVKDAKRILRRGLDNISSEKYVLRLSSKLLTADYVAQKYNGVVFDSDQYSLGDKFLLQVGKKINFQKNLFNENSLKEKLTLLGEEYTLNSALESFDIPFPIVMLLSEYKLKETSESSFINELKNTKFKTLKSEINELFAEGNRANASGSHNVIIDIVSLVATLNNVPFVYPKATIDFTRKHFFRTSKIYKPKSNYSLASRIVVNALMHTETLKKNKKLDEHILWLLYPFYKDKRFEESKWLINQRSMNTWTNQKAWYEAG